MTKYALHAISFYKSRLSPGLPAGCRYLPTCSDYAYEAIQRHGLARGGLLAVRRMIRCNPLSRGGVDPVPGSGAEGRAA